MSGDIMMLEEPYRDGPYLVVRDGTELPARCAICNSPAGDRPVERTFDDQRSPGLIGAAVAGIVNSVKGSNYTGPVTVRLHFCRAHLARRKYAWLLILAMVVIGGAIGAVELVRRQGPNDFGALLPLVVAGGGLFLGFALLTGMFDVWNLKAKRFNDRWAWVKGAGEPFLQTLNQVSQRQG